MSPAWFPLPGGVIIAGSAIYRQTTATRRRSSATAGASVEPQDGRWKVVSGELDSQVVGPVDITAWRRPLGFALGAFSYRQQAMLTQCAINQL